MWDDCRARIRTVSADLVGFDISGFSRFAEEWLTRGDHSSVDDLARVWERAAAPLIDRLIDAGFRIADICGDGVVAWRAAPLEDETRARLLTKLEAEFAADAPGLTLRTAHTRGDLAFVEVEVLGGHFDWATGEAVTALHAALSQGPRRPPGPIPPGALPPTPQEQALAWHWSRTGAEIRTVAALFARYAPLAWMWTDADRVGSLVGAIAAAAAAQDGRLEKVTHDDKGLLFRCAFPALNRDAVVAAALAGQAMLRMAPADQAGVAISEGRVYRGPLRVGEAQATTMHGPAVNRAAKAAGWTVGLVVLADGDAGRAERLRAAGFQPDPDGSAWRPSDANARPASAAGADEQTLFVGRQDALLALHAALTAVQEGTRSVLVEGEPGSGKSALVRRFRADLPPGRRSAAAHAVPDDALRGPWPRLLQTLVAARFADDRSARSAIGKAMLANGLLEREFGILSHLGFDLFPTATDLQLEPLAVRERLDRAFRALLQTAVSEAVLVIEDVHWLNREGWRWVELCQCEGGNRLLVLTRRSSAGGRSAGHQHPVNADVRVTLGRLAKPQSLDLARRLRPDLAGRPKVLATIAALAAGLPLLVEQLARAWPQPDAQGFDTFDQTVVTPSGSAKGEVLDHVLGLRLDGLDASETELLRRLAIERQACRIEDIEGSPQRATKLGVAGRRLTREGLLQQDEPAGIFSLRHALIADAVKRRTPALLLRVLHAGAARRLGRAASIDAEGVGAHWRAARVPHRAAVWLSRAAAQAEATGAIGASADLYQQALDVCPERSRNAVLAVEWRARLAAAAFGVGQLARARYEATICTARRADGGAEARRLLAPIRRALLVQTEIATFTADVPAAVRGLARLRRLGVAKTEGLRGREAALWGYAFALLRARPLAESLLRRAAEGGDRDRYYAQTSRGLIHTCFAEWDRAAQVLGEAIALAPADRLPHENEIATTLLALGCYLRSDAAQSLALFEQIFESARNRDNAMHEAWGLYGSAQALIALGRLDEAEPRLGRAEVLLDGHIDRQSRLICSGLRVELAFRRRAMRALLPAMAHNLAVSGGMPASNFGSFEGYAATPTAALLLLSEGGVPPARRQEVQALARTGIGALARYAALFPPGRPRLQLCRALRAAVLGRPEEARARVARGLTLAGRLDMPGEAARLRAAAQHIQPRQRR